MEKPLLSFVIPAYNASSTIVRCIESIYACGLDKSEFEVVVIDDGSTDDTLHIASEYASRCGNVVVKHHTTNRKPGACVNNGIESSSGIYIQFIGADDVIDSSCFIKGALQQALKWDVDVQANAFVVEIQKDKQTVFGTDYPTELCMTGVEFCENVFDANLQFCSGPMYFWKRDFILRIYRRAVEGRYYEDTDWIEYMLPKAERVTFYNEPVYKALINTNSITRRKRDITVITDYLLMQIRRLENTLICDIKSYNAKIEKFCKQEIIIFLRVRNATKYPFKQLKYLYKSLTNDNFRNMRKFDFGWQANWFFRRRRLWLMAMFFLCRPALIGRSIAAKLRGMKS